MCATYMQGICPAYLQKIDIGRPPEISEYWETSATILLPGTDQGHDGSVPGLEMLNLAANL